MYGMYNAQYNTQYVQYGYLAYLACFIKSVLWISLSTLPSPDLSARSGIGWGWTLAFGHHEILNPSPKSKVLS